jgi:uncharacterized protein
VFRSVSAEGLVYPLPRRRSSRRRRFGARARLWRTPRTRALLVLGVVGLFVEAIKLTAGVYVDLLWFGELHQRTVFWTTLKWKIIAQGIAGFGVASFVLLNFAVVDRVMVGRVNTADLPRPILVLWRYRQLVYPAVALAFGLVVNRWRTGPGWQQLVLWVHRRPFGVTDPVFHRDVGFFIFSLPLYDEVARWLLLTFVFTAVCTVVTYVVAGGLVFERPWSVARPIRVHLLALGALILLVIAWRLRLEQFELVLPHHASPVPGASYTDVHVRLAALRIITALVVITAGVCLLAIVRPLPLRAVVALGAVGALAVVGAAFAPSLVEHYVVKPQELSRESPYVVRSIDSTRRAFGLDRITIRSLPATRKLSEAQLAANGRTVDNIPLWDDAVLDSAMNELESIGSYYRFASPTLDRYMINGAPRVMTVAARQLDLSRLARSGRGWGNERFAYTHGYGIVAVRAANAGPGRYPSFAQGAFDAQRNPLGLRQPRIYFGTEAGPHPAFVVAPSGREEVEQPISGTEPLTYHYDGSGGIPLSSFWRRAAFAAHFGDQRLMLSRTVTSRSRIILRRDVRERLQTLAPFLRWDVTPQTAVINGRVMYLFHGYTTSRDYPYAARVPFGRRLEVNYIRQAAQAAVDAFDGSVRIFVAGHADPIMQAWQAAYPTLFRPASDMPREIRAHLRYPAELFAAQRLVYETYHSSDPAAFWAGVDAWRQPFQLAGPVEAAGEVHFPDPQRLVDPDERKRATASWEMPAQYLFARLPGQTREHFMLTMPFTPRGRNNLVSYLAGWLDDKERPRLTLLNLPRDRVAAGPAQATRRMLSTPAVDSQLQLLNRESRDLGTSSILRIILGAPRIVPFGDNLVQVQPAYISAGGNGIPKLQLITAYANGRVGYGRNLKTALLRAVRGLPEGSGDGLGARGAQRP